MKKLLEIMAALRHPDTGCPWDKQQTFKSIIPYTLEEAYEVADAIENGNMLALKSELGDLLFQVVFYAQLAREQGSFDYQDVVQAISEKLIRRHPHVFSDVKMSDEAELHKAWESAKARERDEQSKVQKASILDGVAQALPALKRAQKLQKRAAAVGFDWPNVEPVLAKIEEEIAELREAMKNNDSRAMQEEMGDVIFSCVNLSRHITVDAEEALRGCNAKFERRFAHVEAQVKASEMDFEQHSIEELEEYWQVAKKREIGGV